MLDHYNKTLEKVSQKHFDKKPCPYKNQADFGVVGEKKFMINAVWWRQWCDYVNFNPESVTPLERPLPNDNVINQSIMSSQVNESYIREDANKYY